MSALSPELILEAVREMTEPQRAELVDLLRLEPEAPAALLSVAAAAEVAAVSEKTIRRKIEAGELAASRLGRVIRIDRAALNSYLAASRLGHAPAPRDGAATRRAASRQPRSAVAIAFRELDRPISPAKSAKTDVGVN